MANQSSQFLKEKGYKPKVTLADRQEHTVEFVDGVIDSVDFLTGEGEQSVMRYSVIEGGEEKQITTTSASLVESLANAQPGDIFKVQMITKNQNGKPVTGFHVEAQGHNDQPTPEKPVEDEINIDDIPFA